MGPRSSHPSAHSLFGMSLPTCVGLNCAPHRVHSAPQNVTLLGNWAFAHVIRSDEVTVEEGKPRHRDGEVQASIPLSTRKPRGGAAETRDRPLFRGRGGRLRRGLVDAGEGEGSVSAATAARHRGHPTLRPAHAGFLVFTIKQQGRRDCHLLFLVETETQK